ncbi:MAG: 5-amino-6-(D-ribitylamino)uracil--L-tyrosine 4-hydroxyphenyl transferase CofH [Chloroflexi bacterium]|nr:5-amino-6-(D-ribitylamino)uracil--L-tyrosine 4-hydroxyphenyl transferase CofH [Chloroflexota bacterium]MCL5076164.1 5-amino-6-(D-ribitylamino)uracil--L-tyrosine 4-hydroxyphenyl transferase CofH [Chloroflexota bacterium]
MYGQSLPPANVVTFSRSITLVPTRRCHNRCSYCSFRADDNHVLSLAEAEHTLTLAKGQGCREALIMSGERPWLEKDFPLTEEEFIAYVYQLCALALRLGLLPHTNIGVLTGPQLGRLKEVNVSMGLMLETASEGLAAHKEQPGKRISERIAHIEEAGRLRIPFTTGLLVGIGESASNRHAALLIIKRLQERYGHIQEVIIQNFKPKVGTPMAHWAEPTLEDMVETVRQARQLLPTVPVQIAPNLTSDCLPLLRAGANDLGGLSPAIDYINPECPWPKPEELGATLSRAGFHLQDRLPVHPEVDADLAPVADALRRRLVGDRVTYVVNRNVNITNICQGRCAFCAFRRDSGEGDAYQLTIAEVLQKAEEAVARQATEVCIQGGLNPTLELPFYLNMVSAIKQRFPHLHIHAFSPMEVWWIAQRNGLSIADTLARLQEAGLDTMPGTAAEILVDEVRQKICPQKLTTAEWVEVITTAHRLGIKTTATMMFGHIENWHHRLRHLEILRHIQLESGGFTELVLLPFVPGATPLARRYHLRPISLEEVLKVTAYARLYLGADLPNIQNSWVKIGVEGVKRSLSWGANDFGGTLMEENISRSAGSAHGQSLTRDQIEEAICQAGRIPVERDTLYNLRTGR